MKKKLRNIIIWSFTVITAVLLLGFANAERASSLCWKFDVEVEQLSGLYFIDEASVRDYILDLGDPIVGSEIEQIDLQKIQRALLQLPSVDHAEVFTTVDGCFTVKVSQRTPLYRVLNKEGDSYYIDTRGGRMPLSDQYTARVPILTGEINAPFAVNSSDEKSEKQLANAAILFEFLKENNFWKAQVEHVYVNNKGDFVLVPRVGSAHIVLGQPTDLEDKFSRLKLFYLEMTHRNNLNQYKRINVKYRDQVVCERFF